MKLNFREHRLSSQVRPNLLFSLCVKCLDALMHILCIRSFFCRTCWDGREQPKHKPFDFRNSTRSLWGWSFILLHEARVWDVKNGVLEKCWWTNGPCSLVHTSCQSRMFVQRDNFLGAAMTPLWKAPFGVGSVWTHLEGKWIDQVPMCFGFPTEIRNEFQRTATNARV